MKEREEYSCVGWKCRAS